MNKTREKTRQPVVVITGASAGVGRAVVRRFARDGARIALIARGQEGLAAAAEEVRRAGGQALPLSVDVAVAQAVEEAAGQVEDRFGPIAIWINAAFAGMLAPFLDMTAAEYRRITDVTYLGQIHGARAALRRMVPRNRGSVVLVGSALAYRGIPLQSAYCGAKHAIQGFHDSIRAELLHMRSRVHVSMVQLPGVNTPQFDWIRTTMPHRPRPASPPYQPEIAAEAIHWAAHHRRKSVQLGWPTLQAIWGDRLASPLLDRYLARTAWNGQQDSVPVPPNRQDNLDSPVPGDFGAHGRFDRIARRSSPQFWLSRHRAPLALGLLLGMLAGIGGALRRGRRG